MNAGVCLTIMWSRMWEMPTILESGNWRCKNPLIDIEGLKAIYFECIMIKQAVLLFYDYFCLHSHILYWVIRVLRDLLNKEKFKIQINFGFVFR